MTRSIFDLSVDDGDNPNKGKQYTVKQGDYCASIVATQCDYLSEDVCKSFTDCPEICDSANVCPKLQAGQTIHINCQGAEPAASTWRTTCPHPTPGPTGTVPSEFKKVGWKGKYSCKDIVSAACEDKKLVNVTETYKVKQDDAYCVTNEAWKSAQDSGDACGAVKANYNDEGLGIGQPWTGEGRDWRAWGMKAGDKCTGMTSDEKWMSGKIRRCPRVLKDNTVCNNLQSGGQGDGFGPDQVAGMCGPPRN